MGQVDLKPLFTPPSCLTASLRLKNDGWKTSISFLGRYIFRGDMLQLQVGIQTKKLVLATKNIARVKSHPSSCQNHSSRCQKGIFQGYVGEILEFQEFFLNP